MRAVPRSRHAHLKQIAFEVGEQLWDADSPYTFVLFPVRGVISLQVVTESGKRVEVGLVGHEGYAEVPFLLGGERTQLLGMGLTDGEAVLMEPAEFQAALSQNRFRAGVEHYARMHLCMLRHFAVCNRIHAIDDTLVGHLLLLQDRTGLESFNLTQEFFSRVLGVRQATISRAAANLQRLGAITYDRRGRWIVVDREQLLRQACSCYRTIQKDFEGLVAALRAE